MPGNVLEPFLGAMGDWMSPHSFNPHPIFRLGDFYDFLKYSKSLPERNDCLDPGSEVKSEKVEVKSQWYGVRKNNRCAVSASFTFHSSLFTSRFL